MSRKCARAIFIMCVWIEQCVSYHKSLVWSGGPLRADGDSRDLWTTSGLYVRDNIIATKALSYNEKVYIITPRIKGGVLATVWQVMQETHDIELLPFPNLKAHELADCRAIQNAVDSHLDHLGQLWILDSGIIDTDEQPQCMCPPKVVVVSVVWRSISKSIELSSLTVPTTRLQNVAVEYGFIGKPYIQLYPGNGFRFSNSIHDIKMIPLAVDVEAWPARYVSDASRGAILVYDTTTESGWVVVACAPAAGLQLALVKHNPTHSVLILVRLQYQGVIEVDTSLLKRKTTPSTLTVLGERTKPVSLLGFDAHHVYFRHIECSDVLRWDARRPYEPAQLDNLYSSGPQLTPTSVSADPLKPFLIILESNYGDALLVNLPTYHRINYISIL